MAVSSAVDPSAVARVLGIATIFENRRGSNTTKLPQRLALVGQGSSAVTYPTTKAQYTNSLDVANVYGFGSPLHLATRQLLPDNGDGIGTIPLTIYPLEDDGSGAAATSTITPSGAQTVAGSYSVRVGGIESAPFVIDAGDVVGDVTSAITGAINATLEMPVIASDNATDVGLVCKWAGESSDLMAVEILGPSDGGITFVIIQPSGGLVNPSVQPALDQVGNVWETMMLNCLNTADETNLDRFETFGEGRWGSLVRKPLVVFTGTNTLGVNDAIVIPESRATDRVNSQLPCPGSPNLLFVIAAREVARIIKLANVTPAHDYGSQRADGLIPGADGDQWDYLERDQAVKGGSSTIEVKDGVVNVSDVVTFYHPSGDPLPSYRFVVDIVKLQNVIFNFDLVFASAEWDGAPLIPDDQPTAEPTAKKPKMARAAAASIVDGLALDAILSDPETSKAGIIAEIDSSNPKRLNLCVPVSVSGNTNIKSVDLKWGFFFGTPSIVA